MRTHLIIDPIRKADRIGRIRDLEDVGGRGRGGPRQQLLEANGLHLKLKIQTVATEVCYLGVTKMHNKKSVGRIESDCLWRPRGEGLQGEDSF